MEIIFYTDIHDTYPSEMIKIIDWYLMTFSYRFMKAVWKDKNNEYQDISDNNINYIRQDRVKSRHSIKFIFETIEDKMLFDLTWK